MNHITVYSYLSSSLPHLCSDSVSWNLDTGLVFRIAHLEVFPSGSPRSSCLDTGPHARWSGPYTSPARPCPSASQTRHLRTKYSSHLLLWKSDKTSWSDADSQTVWYLWESNFHSLSYSLTHSHTHTHSLSLSLSHAQTPTHTKLYKLFNLVKTALWWDNMKELNGCQIMPLTIWTCAMRNSLAWKFYHFTLIRWIQ